METKEELLALKSGIEKLLNMKRYFCAGFSEIIVANCSGLCYFVKLAYRHHFITYSERVVIEELLQNYGESKGFYDDEYFWPEEEWQPRAEWLTQELEKVNQKLNMETKENQFFKAIDFEEVFDAYLNECEETIDCVTSIKVNGVEYGVEIVGNLLIDLKMVEVFTEEDGKPIDINHATLLKWANIELDKYLERNKEAIMRTFPYQFEPMPTDGVRCL